MVYSWVISAMDLQAKPAELIAPGSLLSEDAALTLHCFFSQSFTEQRCILMCSPLKLYQMLKCEENYSSFVFLIFKCVVPKDLWQFIKTGYVARAGEKSYPSLLICCLFPSEICSYFRQHIVLQWLFFFPNVSRLWVVPRYSCCRWLLGLWKHWLLGGVSCTGYKSFESPLLLCSGLCSPARQCSRSGR